MHTKLSHEEIYKKIEFFMAIFYNFKEEFIGFISFKTHDCKVHFIPSYI